ncbi:CpaF family protein [Trinickia acidisoli]|uniref:CpaF family protein n=1 Tax=Trinickia acidisoli TaxID=2767482 RepID=UPI001A8D568D|nr:CpaF family protein [Trinickia acidisoli]
MFGQKHRSPPREPTLAAELGQAGAAALHDADALDLLDRPLPTASTGTPSSARSEQQAMSDDSAGERPTSDRSDAERAAASQAAGRTQTLIRTDAFRLIRSRVLSQMNVSAAVMQTRDHAQMELARTVAGIIESERLKMTMTEQSQIIDEMLNDMFGVGPIEPLLADDSVTDILVNGADQVYVERYGKLELTPLKFRDNAHVVNVAQRIAASIGRRVDESSPMVDARLPDGSRVNVVLPPLAIRGACIAIRKFAKRDITLARMTAHGGLSRAMARTLEIASACRLNIVISGGTGSGKTTLLNAMSHFIDVRERIVTIEDAAELQLQQPHVVSLETRPENAEGVGAVSQRDLVRNALRMRPDRIILGETRGPEAFDVLQAMNTGHDGSMTTIHANTPRDTITRLESMVIMANGNLPLISIRRQIASAVQLIVQTERMRDGVRRVTHITEIVGLEGEVILTQDLFTFKYDDGATSEHVRGRFEGSALRPAFAAQAAHFGLEESLIKAIHT